MEDVDRVLAEAMERHARAKRASRQVETLTQRLGGLRRQAAELEARRTKEERELLAAMKGGGVAGFLLSVMEGGRDKRIAKERAEALAAAAESEAKDKELRAAEAALVRAESEAASLPDAERALSMARRAKRALLQQMGHGESARLDELDEEREVACALRTELVEADAAAKAALTSLEGWVRSLDRAKRAARTDASWDRQWASLDSEGRIAAANARAEEVRLALQTLRREMADVSERLELSVDDIQYSPVLGDLFDNALGDWMTVAKVGGSQTQARETLVQVRVAQGKIRDDLAECEAWLERLDQERDGLLAS